MAAGVTLDTGALIGLERRDRWITKRLDAWRADNTKVTVPAAVLAEWWRGSDRAEILSMVDVEPMTAVIAMAAGLALGEVRDAHVVDAIVMASAALRGDLVYTVDFDDLMRLRGHFPTVRVFSPTQEPRSSKATPSRENRRLD